MNLSFKCSNQLQSPEGVISRHADYFVERLHGELLEVEVGLSYRQLDDATLLQGPARDESLESLKYDFI